MKTYRTELPDDSAGREDLEIMFKHMALLNNACARMKAFVGLWAPWMPPAEAESLIDHIAALAPFGAANPEPRFAFPSLCLAHVEPVGSNHLRATLADTAGPARLKAIAFRVADTPLGAFLAAARGRAIHVAGHLRRDDYRGGDAVQLVIDDAAPVEG